MQTVAADLSIFYLLDVTLDSAASLQYTNDKTWKKSQKSLDAQA